MSFSIPDPLSFDADTAIPPAYLLAALTAAERKLLDAFLAARDSAREARAARTASVVAFREASRTNRDGDRIPLPSVAIDAWRALQEATLDAETVVRRAESSVKPAYVALRDALESSPRVAKAAEAETQTRHTAALEALSALESALAELGAADRFTRLYDRREGVYVVTLADDLRRIAKASRAILAPTWDNPPAKAFQ